MVEYEHDLVPDDPTYKPDAQQISRLVNVLHDNRYVIKSDARDSAGKTWGRTGDDLGPRPGGALYLFAILIDCGKCYDRDEPSRAFEAFLRLCEEAIGAPLKIMPRSA